MKYHLFTGDCYYAKGGGRDYVATSTDPRELILLGEKFIKNNKAIDMPKAVWFHVIDENFKMIHQSVPQAHSY